MSSGLDKVMVCESTVDDGLLAKTSAIGENFTIEYFSIKFSTSDSVFKLIFNTPLS